MGARLFILVFCFLTLATRNRVTCRNKIKTREFPPHFLFGASTAAYQIEGAWDADGKAPSIWDTMTHLDPSPIRDGSTGDIAANSYRFYQKDIDMTSNLGLDFYRFSISWPRILPTGIADRINEAGVEYYNNLINGLLNKNVTPFVTIYHWDLPENLQKMGGWTNPNIKNWFSDYAKVLFDKFGDRVRHWVTINEPKQICNEGYGSDLKAPMLNITGVADYMCARNLLIAHAAAYHLYDDEYRKLQNGKIGIAISCAWSEPASDTLEDHAATIDSRMFDFGLYAHPIFFHGGDFPQAVKRNVAFKSAEQGFPKSRLPQLTAEEVTYISKTSDFFGMNHYTTMMAYRDQSLEGMYAIPSFMDDASAVLVKNPTWPQSKSSWLQDVPWGFYRLLKYVRELYDNPPIYILENGWSTSGGLLDEDRISYMRGYLNALLDAVEDGVDVRAYSVWSLMDNFEWRNGYTEKFGIYEVDFSSSERKRTPRKSAYIYKEIIRSRKLDPFFEPHDFSTGTKK